MTKDHRNSAARAGSAAEDHRGQPVTLDDIAANFALYGPERRSGALEKFDSELMGDIDSGAHSLRRHAQLIALRKRMGGVHEALRKARR